MFQKLRLRTKLVAIVVPPLVILALIAAYSVLLSFRGADDVTQLSGDVRTLGVVALATCLLSALAVIVVGRSITNPIDDLADAADDLASNRIPQLVESLRNPAAPTPTFDPIEIPQKNDEMGKLITSLNSVQDAVTGVASEQKTVVQKGLSDLVVNLARRNQSLLDRQIETIDSLESNEEDPDRLEELFGLDHLATRMRRNAESLLVVAGAEPSRRRGGPVAVADVLRVAMSEIEDYRHVSLLSIDPAEIGSQAAVDLAHLLSELMENATQFSPPDSPVDVNGMAQSDGCYLVSVADHGLGMSDEQVAASNHVLSNPPELGLGLSRSLGFIVVGRLAQRLDVKVELTHTTGGGVTALVLVPASVLTGSYPSASDHSGAPVGMEPPANMTSPAALATSGGSVPEALSAPAAAQPGSPAQPADATWTPPAMPVRGESPLAAPNPGAHDAPVGDPFAMPTQNAEMPPAAAPSAAVPPAAAIPPPAALSGSAQAPPAALPPEALAQPAALAGSAEAPESEALAKLLGVDSAAPAADPFAAPSQAATPANDVPDPFAPPSGVPNPFGQSPEAPDIAGPGSSDFSAPEMESPEFNAPEFSPSEFSPSEASPAEFAPSDFSAPAQPGAHDIQPGFGESPTSLDQAMPSGEQFDDGVASLLETPGAASAPPAAEAAASTTSSGLVKRNRAESQAPVSEGRPIAASVRSPDEIREMLARYRDGRSRPGGDAAPDSPYESGEQA